jgi:hypothetical protein
LTDRVDSKTHCLANNAANILGSPGRAYSESEADN